MAHADADAGRAPSRSRSGYEQVIRHFERAYQQGKGPRIEDHLPPAPGARRLVLIELVHAELEFRLKAGQPARVEEYLARFPELKAEADQVADLLLTEYEVRRKSEAALTLGEYRRRFPDLAGRLELGAGTVGGPGAPAPDATVPGSAISIVPPPARPAAGGSRYRVQRLHARGGLGEVFVAEDTELKRTVALKRIQGRYAGDADSCRRFLQEAEVTGRLEHPGIVPVYGLTRDADGQPCYAMRFIEGESLQEAVARFHAAPAAGAGTAHGERGLALRQLLTRFVAVCNAVAYAHSQGVVHRDLKPQNIMLGKYGETLVVDWGLAKPLASQEPSAGAAAPPGPGVEGTRVGEALGTPAYMSPEQAAGRWGELGPATDIYGLGATLYAVLTGRPPAAGRDLSEVLDSARRGHFARPRQVRKDVPAALEAVCLKAMAVRPEDRYRTGLELAADVEHWLADEPVSAYPEPVTARVGRLARRHRTAVTALLVIAAVVVAGLFLWQGAEQRRELAEQREREQARRGLDELRRAALTDEQLGLAELRNGRFDAAATLFRNAGGRLAQAPPLADLRAKLAARQERVERLLTFAREFDAAEQLIAERQAPDEELDRDGLAHLDKGLAQLGVTGLAAGPPTLPDGDLDEAGRAQLRKDVYRALLLRAGVRAKSGLKHFGTPGFEPTYQATLAALAAARRLKPDSYVADAIELYCHAGMGRYDRIRPTPRRRPGSGAGHYLYGFLHFWVALSPPRGKLNDVVKEWADKFSGVDFNNPLPAAEQALRTAAAHEPRHYWSHAWLGLTLAALHNPGAAELAFDTCVALQPGYRFGHNWRLEMIEKQVQQSGQDAPRRARLRVRSLVAADAWVRHRPGDAAAHVWRAVAHEAQGDRDAARADMAKALQTDPPKSAQAHAQRANIYQGRGEFEKSLADYDAAVRLAPGEGIHRANRGFSYFMLRRYPQAVSDFDEAIRLAPALGWPSRWRGVARAELGDVKGAVADFARAAERTAAFNPDGWEIRGLHVRGLLAAGDGAAYRKVCTELLKQFATTTNLDAARAVAWMCVLHPDGGALMSQALPLAQRAEVPWQPDSLRVHGAALYRGRQAAAAADKLTEAVKSAYGKGDPRSWLFLAMAQQRLGRGADAVTSFKTAARLIPQAQPPGGNGPPPWPWELRLEVRLLRQEAEAALGLKRP